LKSNDTQPPGNLRGGDQFPLSGSRALLACPLPSRRRGHVAFPERPGSALPRAHRVDRTPPLAIVEDAIAVGPLAQAAVVADGARVQAAGLFNPVSAVLRNLRDLLRRHPNVPRRPGAAVTAARAAEAQAVLIPWLGHAVSSSLRGR